MPLLTHHTGSSSLPWYYRGSKLAYDGEVACAHGKILFHSAYNFSSFMIAI